MWRARIPHCVFALGALIFGVYLISAIVSVHRQRLLKEELQMVQFQDGLYSQPMVSFIQESNPNETHPVMDVLRTKIRCDNRQLHKRFYQRGAYWVLENLVAARLNRFQCHETVTYTTHADFSFLDNLGPLAERWQAPISIALYTPMNDLRNTVDAIRYVRNCLDNYRQMASIKDYVSFHLYFDNSNTPANIPKVIDDNDVNCTENPLTRPSFKEAQKLFYPVNVGRNVARDAATTYFVLASDIELYPSLNLVPNFLAMIANEQFATVPSRRVYPLKLFEVDEQYQVPPNKTELLKMLEAKQAIRFHQKICPTCHQVPEGEKWEKTPEYTEMRIFSTTKRQGKFKHWEPIYIGTQEEPYYDERLSWEGKSDKMTQGYILCILDYQFALLSDAFLCHRPGIKTMKEAVRRELEKKSWDLIKTTIAPEIKAIYGERRGCQL